MSRAIIDIPARRGVTQLIIFSRGINIIPVF